MRIPKMAKKKSKKSKIAKKDPEEVLEEEDMDRFAGSSAEEDNADGFDDEDHDSDNHDDDDEEEEADEAVAMKSPDRGYEAPADDEDSSSGSDADKGNEVDDGADSSDEEEDGGPKAAGMANAMARILGIANKGTMGTKPVVLSKTTTRIQKQAAQVREQEKELKEKRQHNRERELVALHIPLSVATSHHVANKSKALVKELEMERTHRRVATRGVVALFNAIAQHQNQVAKDKEAALLSTSKKTDVKKMTKHSFLDMIKNKAAEKPVDGNGMKSKGTNDEPQWKALQDDYMMNPKKNWDEESSDEEEADERKSKKRTSRKKQKTVAT